MNSANIAKSDIPAVRKAAAQIPMENLVIDKWEQINKELGQVSTEQSVFEMKVVLFMTAKILKVLVEDVQYRGTDSSLEAINKVEKIKSDTEALLTSLNQSIELGKY